MVAFEFRMIHHNANLIETFFNFEPPAAVKMSVVSTVIAVASLLLTTAVMVPIVIPIVPRSASAVASSASVVLP